MPISPENALVTSEPIKITLHVNLMVTAKQCEGLTHEDSLLQLPFPGNCLNWTIGHIVHHRGFMLERLGKEHPWPQAKREAYATGNAPITGADSPGVLPFDDLMADMESTQAALEAVLDEVSEASLNEIVDPERGRTLGQILSGLAWHETYHVGQTELLRQLAEHGRSGAIGLERVGWD